MTITVNADTPTVTAITSDEEFAKASFTISPIPTAGVLNITVVERVDYRLVNMAGHTLQQGALAIGERKIDISSFAKGVYLLHLKTDKGSFSRRVIKN